MCSRGRTKTLKGTAAAVLVARMCAGTACSCRSLGTTRGRSTHPVFRVLLLRGIAWSAKEPVDRFNDLVLAPDADVAKSGRGDNSYTHHSRIVPLLSTRASRHATRYFARARIYPRHRRRDPAAVPLPRGQRHHRTRDGHRCRTCHRAQGSGCTGEGDHVRRRPHPHPRADAHRQPHRSAPRHRKEEREAGAVHDAHGHRPAVRGGKTEARRQAGCERTRGHDRTRRRQPQRLRCARHARGRTHQAEPAAPAHHDAVHRPRGERPVWGEVPQPHRPRGADRRLQLRREERGRT